MIAAMIVMSFIVIECLFGLTGCKITKNIIAKQHFSYKYWAVLWLFEKLFVPLQAKLMQYEKMVYRLPLDAAYRFSDRSGGLLLGHRRRAHRLYAPH
jgi:hypothetical protein